MWAGTEQMMDYLLNFLLEVLGLLFTVLVWCRFMSLDVVEDTTTGNQGPLLDYEVKGYSTVVLFGNNLCRLAGADGS